MSNIHTRQELRDEIIRLRHASNIQKAEIRNSFSNLKNSLTPISLILSLIGELKHDKVIQTALTVFEKIREYFRKK